jgi:N-acyl-D-aspartate/D-glutamate deacylase
MHDIVIRGETIPDGTGAPGFVGDIAIDGKTWSAAVSAPCGAAERRKFAAGVRRFTL